MAARLKQLHFVHGNGYCLERPIPHALFLTSDYALLILAHCVECGEDLHVEIPLEQLIAACPGVPGPASASTLLTADDIEFLRALHIVPDLETNETRKAPHH